MENQLEEFLNSGDVEEPAEEVETVETETEEPETGATEEVEDSPPESEKSEAGKPPEGHVPYAALADERAKRQELEAQLRAQLEQRVKNLETPKEQEAEQEIDFLDDPDAWRDRFVGQIEQRVQAAEQRGNARFLQLVEQQARASHEDYDAIVSVFHAAAKENPALARECMSSPNPAEYAYQSGMSLKRLNDAGGDLDSLLKAEREKAAQQAIEQYKAANPSAEQRVAGIPESLTTITGAKDKARNEPVDVPLDSMFNTF